MVFKIMTFGIAREIVGTTVLEISTEQLLKSIHLTQNNILVADLRAYLFHAYPPLARLVSLLIAVNETYAADDLVLQENDEIVLIPPVAGG